MEALERTTERAIQSLGIDLGMRLREETPKDTTWASVNWVPSIGIPFTGTAGTREMAEQGALDLGPHEGGLATLTFGYKLEQGPVHITNNVHYIKDLNFGSSSQAPASFVQVAIVDSILTVATRK